MVKWTGVEGGLTKMGIDIHEKRHYNDATDHNPACSNCGNRDHPSGSQNYWSRNIAAAAQKAKWRAIARKRKG